MNIINNMSKKKIIILVVVLVVFIGLVIAGILYFKGEKNHLASGKDVKVVENKNKGVIKEQTVEGILFKKVKVVYENGVSTFTVDVKNTTKDTIDVPQIDVTVKDKDGNIIVVLSGFLDDDIEAGKTTSFSVGTTGDLREATDLAYEIVK